MIEIERLTKRFGDTEAVSNVSLSVPDGAFLVLLGPSGCGKTTLLRMLAGLEPASAGRIVFDGRVVTDGAAGRDVDPARRGSGLVFQSYALWPHMSVRGNVAWPLKVAGMTARERDERVREVLTLLGIEGLADRYPNEISGGQQQRVAIARTIAPRPRILLFDEPLSNLDAKLRVDMRTELMRLHRKIGATTVHVTHDQIEAMTMATHVAVLREGRVEQFGTPLELVERPATAFVATFLGTPPNNLLPITSTGGRAFVDDVPVALAPPVPEPCQAMIRAESIVLCEAGDAGALPFELIETSPVAGRSMVTATRGPLRVTAVLEHRPAACIGETVHFRLPPAPAAWFDSHGERLH